jgi:hypothetical protein
MADVEGARASEATVDRAAQGGGEEGLGLLRQQGITDVPTARRCYAANLDDAVRLVLQAPCWLCISRTWSEPAGQKRQYVV